ncbi:hypothetical protein WN55_00254 [Dufourea novaeangliae]|uniref:Uncharacterized protein n=1 Tax=Dufourea novaeangliae TaxID=178035 RepID=A0A154PCK9_DUFNO|nr:hypothetical protein WN55_00254 [Dufourea novaeangliae]
MLDDPEMEDSTSNTDRADPPTAGPVASPPPAIRGESAFDREERNTETLDYSASSPGSWLREDNSNGSSSSPSRPRKNHLGESSARGRSETQRKEQKQEDPQKASKKPSTSSVVMAAISKETETPGSPEVTTYRDQERLSMFLGTGKEIARKRMTVDSGLETNESTERKRFDGLKDDWRGRPVRSVRTYSPRQVINKVNSGTHRLSTKDNPRDLSLVLMPRAMSPGLSEASEYIKPDVLSNLPRMVAVLVNEEEDEGTERHTAATCGQDGDSLSLLGIQGETKKGVRSFGGVDITWDMKIQVLIKRVEELIFSEL